MAVIQKRKGKKGVSYRVLIRMKAHTETKTFHNKAEAKKWAYETEDAYRSGKGLQVAAGKATLEECIDAFERNPARAHFKSHDRVVTMLREWETIPVSKGVWFGDLAIGTITTPMIEAHLQDMLAAVSPATVNRKKSALSVLFDTLAKKGIANPVKGIKSHKEPRGRIRFLSDEERVRLFAAIEAPEVACPIIKAPGYHGGLYGDAPGRVDAVDVG